VPAVRVEAAIALAAALATSGKPLPKKPTRYLVQAPESTRYW